MSETPTQSEQIVALAEAVRLLAWHLEELHVYMNHDAEGRAEMKAVRDNMIELMKNASLGRSGRMGSDESTGMATNMLTPGDENPLGKPRKLVTQDSDKVELSFAYGEEDRVPPEFLCTLGVTTPAGGHSLYKYEDGGATATVGLDAKAIETLIATLAWVQGASEGAGG